MYAFSFLKLVTNIYLTDVSSRQCSSQKVFSQYEIMIWECEN